MDVDDDQPDKATTYFITIPVMNVAFEWTINKVLYCCSCKTLKMNTARSRLSDETLRKSCNLMRSALMWKYSPIFGESAVFETYVCAVSRIIFKIYLTLNTKRTSCRKSAYSCVISLIEEAAPAFSPSLLGNGDVLPVAMTKCVYEIYRKEKKVFVSFYIADVTGGRCE